jgi:parallel beta-helix repeat protein
MKYFIKIISIIGLLAVSHFAYAESINRTFVTGDTLEAIHLNEATTAINDNDARITSLEGGTGIDITVDCDLGEMIAKDDIAGKTIEIRGTCTESPTFTADDKTLQAAPGLAATVIGTIKVDGAQRFRIEGITVTGSTDAGILIINGATATIVDNIINAHSSTGISVKFGSSAVLTGNTITGNGDSGIAVLDNSQANLRGGNAVSGNALEEIFVARSSSFRAGVSPYTGAKDTFTEVGADPVFHVKESSSADIRNSDILCTTLCPNAVDSLYGSTFRAQNNTNITGNIAANQGGVRVQTTATFSGKLSCAAGGYSYGNVSCGQTCNGSVTGTCTP